MRADPDGACGRGAAVPATGGRRLTLLHASDLLGGDWLCGCVGTRSPGWHRAFWCRTEGCANRFGLHKSKIRDGPERRGYFVRDTGIRAVHECAGIGWPVLWKVRLPRHLIRFESAAVRAHDGTGASQDASESGGWRVGVDVAGRRRPAGRKPLIESREQTGHGHGVEDCLAALISTCGDSRETSLAAREDLALGMTMRGRLRDAGNRADSGA